MYRHFDIVSSIFDIYGKENFIVLKKQGNATVACAYRYTYVAEAAAKRPKDSPSRNR